MTSQPDSRLISSLASLSRAAGAVVILLGGLVLVGWVLDITALKSVLPGLVTIKVNTAVAFVLAGMSLWMLWTGHPDQRMRRIARACAFVVPLIGSLTLSEHLLGWDLGIDQLLIKEPLGAWAPPTAPTTSACG